MSLNKRVFSDYYTKVSYIISGSYSKVYKCIRKSDNKQFALKQISKFNLSKKEINDIIQEIRILKSLNHPNIVKIYDLFETNNHFYLILELCSGGDLLDLMNAIETNTLNEYKVACLVYRLSKTIEYCHINGIVHRDLKLDNILLTSDGIVKISDFGLAHYVTVQPKYHRMYTCLGTPYYVITGNGYGPQTDYWALGVIVYKLLCNNFPFIGSNIQQLYKNIIDCKLHFKDPIWKYISSDCKEFIKGLLEPNESKRLSLRYVKLMYFVLCRIYKYIKDCIHSQILSHKWIVKTLKLQVKKKSVKYNKNTKAKSNVN